MGDSAGINPKRSELNLVAIGFPDRPFVDTRNKKHLYLINLFADTETGKVQGAIVVDSSEDKAYFLPLIELSVMEKARYIMELGLQKIKSQVPSKPIPSEV